MASIATPSAAVPGMIAPSRSTQGIQRECTLCGRVVTNCAAHTGFVVAEGLSLGGIGYAIYLSSMALGVFSGGFFLAAGMGQFCWLRYRNVQALGDAATDVGNAADATLAAAGHLELGALQGAEAARRASVAAGRVLGAAEELAGATTSGHAAGIAKSADEIRSSAAGVGAVAAAIPLQLEELRQLLGATSTLSRDMSIALIDMKKTIRSNTSEIAQIADLETRFEVASTRLSGGLSSGVEELKQVLMVMAQASNLAMQIMRENNGSLEASLEEKNTHLVEAIARAEAATSRIRASDQERVALTGRLEQLQRDNEALQTRLDDTLARLEAERRSLEDQAPRATATIANATRDLASERGHWEDILAAVRACVTELSSLRGDASSRIEVTIGEAKTGE